MLTHLHHIRLPHALVGLSLLASLSSAFMQVERRLPRVSRWIKAPTHTRPSLQYGRFAPTIRRVQDQVPESASILVLSDEDPGLLAYALFPRRLYQRDTLPEIYAQYMHRLPSAYPVKSPEDFPVDWILNVTKETQAHGGELWSRVSP